MRLSTGLLAFAAAILAFESFSASAHGQSIPDSGAFEPVECNGGFSSDGLDDVDGIEGARDIVGAGTQAAYFVAHDDEYVYMRMRVDDDSLIDPGFRPFGWGFAIDADGDLTDFEALVMLDDAAGEVRVFRNTVSDGSGDPADPPNLPAAFSYDAATHARIEAAPLLSLFGGDGDFFVTIAAPKDDLEAIGVQLGMRHFWAGTSIDGIALNGDIACASGAQALEDIAVDPVRIGTFVSISHPSEGEVLVDSTPTITGITEPGNTVTVSIDGGAEAGADVNGEGEWTFTAPELAQGEYTIEVVATAPEGPMATDEVSFEIDTSDTDECAAGTDTCDPNAICENRSPGFVCICNPGYTGDGQTCAPDSDNQTDTDGDGIPDEVEQDAAEDGDLPDDIDGDGLDNWEDTDSDNDGVPDGDELGDIDGDGIPDYLDPDARPSGPPSPGLAGGALCAVSAPGAGGSPFALLVALGLALALGRRRARAGAVLALALVLGVPQGASAQTQLDVFRATETTDDGFVLRSSSVMEHLALEGQLVFDYANDPLVYESNLGDADTEAARVVAHELVGTALVSLGLVDRALVYVGVPVVLMMEGDDASGLPGVAPADGFGVGDLILGTRVRLLGDGSDGFGLAVQATITAPLSRVDDDQAYRGEDRVTFIPYVLADYRVGRLGVALNVGARVRENRTIAGNTRLGEELSYGLGVTYALVEDALDLSVELLGKTSFEDFFDREASPLELIGGLRYRDASGLSAGLAAGPGLVRGFGSPDVRVIGTLGYRRPLAQDEPAHEPAEVIPPAELSDMDNDGLVDGQDRCPLEPEDADDFEDGDGCPDVDNDADEVLDVDDGAPNDPEDRDGFEDEDGVPDPDNDGDSVLDVEDRCPLEPGEVEFEGCPNPDRDGDGVPNVRDNCPDEPGPAANQGCVRRQRVRLEEDRIEILDAVYFATGSDRILRRSYRLLDNVAAVLAQHPEIDHLRIEGHTDSRGSHDRNVRLSEGRASSVVDYLVRKGVSRERLEARGFGPDHPVVPNARRASEHAQNRRVEFNIIREGRGEQP